MLPYYYRFGFFNKPITKDVLDIQFYTNNVKLYPEKCVKIMCTYRMYGFKRVVETKQH